MRELINKYGFYIAGAIILLGIIFAWWSLKPIKPENGNPNLSFYIDEETGDESSGSANLFPPLMGKAGRPTVVRVVKYTCDGKTLVPAYYMKFTDEAKAQLEAIPPVDPNDHNPPKDPRPDIMTAGEMVRSAAPDSKWVLAHSDEGSATMTFPAGGQAFLVYPNK